MNPPIKTRGESEIKVGDRTLKLKSSFAALCAIEEKLNSSVIVLANRAKDGDIRAKDVAIMLWALHSAAGGKMTINEAGDLIYETGYLKPLPDLMKVLGDAMTAGNKEQDQEEVQVADPNAQKTVA